MRAEDKAAGHAQVHDLGRRAVVAEVDESVEDHLLDRAVVLDGEARGRSPAAYDLVAQALRGRPVDPGQLATLTDDERAAVARLEVAVGGRDALTGALVYAEDRRDLLEQALAALQPLLAAGADPWLATLHEQHLALVDDVKALREELGSLADAQEEVRADAPPVLAKASDDDDDNGGDADADEDADGRASESAREGRQHADGDADGDATASPPDGSTL